MFYVHNRVEALDRAAARPAEVVPEARIATEHGKMGEHQLKRVIQDFWEKRSDVLVTTTVVETGLDVSNGTPPPWSTLTCSGCPSCVHRAHRPRLPQRGQLPCSYPAHQREGLDPASWTR